MRTIPEIQTDMKVLFEQIEGEDAIEEVNAEYVPYEAHMKSLLATENVEDYLLKYEEICQEDNAILEHYDIKDMDTLKTYIEENEVDILALHTQTVKATWEALKFLIYEAEDEEY